MAMSVQVDGLTGAGPTTTAITSFKFNRDDTLTGTTAGIPTPSTTGTKFSWVKSLQIEITATGGLTMTNVLVGKTANETITGSKLWRVTSHSSYTQATVEPSDTGDNNVTGPTLNGAVASALELITAPPSAYAAGPFNTTGRKGNIVELAAGIDNTNVTSGTAVASPTIRFKWSEG
jgi:hypothetical protein